jgi:hypothetical protein
LDAVALAALPLMALVVVGGGAPAVVVVLVCAIAGAQQAAATSSAAMTRSHPGDEDRSAIVVITQRVTRRDGRTPRAVM